MPTYEYRCPEGHEFESFVQKMSDAKSELPCPTCGVIAARRMSAGSGFLFKGSGFYITDYGKDGKKAERDAASKSALSTSSAKSDKSDKASDAGQSSKSAADSQSNAGSGSAAATSAAPSTPAAPTATPAKPNASKPTPKSGPEK